MLWDEHDSELLIFFCWQAKRTLLMRHEAEIKSNAYWLGLMAHLQAASVPRKVKLKSLLLIHLGRKQNNTKKYKIWYITGQSLKALNFMSLKEYAVSLALSLCNFSLDSSSDHLSGCQDISCIKDLTLPYKSATAEDIYITYEQLKIDENS